MKWSLLLFALAFASRAFAATASVDAGGSFTLAVTNDGTAPFQYQWHKDGLTITGATKATYTVAVAAAADAGNYTVRVTNSAGSVVSDTAAITLIIKPPTKATTSASVTSAP